MSNNILKEFQQKRDRILQVYDELIKNGFVPASSNGKEYTPEIIEGLKLSLNNEEFTISVCGQINAGKSSFLNYLLFNGKYILPADDTPWTAKLSTVTYGEKEAATVTYYSTAEWEELKNQEINDEDSNRKSTYYEKFLKDDVGRAALQGVSAESYILQNNKIQADVSLGSLTEYVTKPGIYTPFVKSVAITVNNEACKDVIFVDTPGINDRNELRSKVTTDWVSRSSAVIYLFYTGQPLSQPDYEFIDKHLSAISSDKILFVLTKADSSGDYQNAVSYVEESLKNDPELKGRRLFTDDKKVYPISSLAALLKYKLEKGISLSEDEEWHLERMNEDGGDYIERYGYIPEFVEAIKSQLMSEKGASLIVKAKKSIEDIGKVKINSLNYKLSNLHTLERDLNSDKEKLQNDISENGDRTKKIEDFNKIFKEKLRNLYKDITNETAKILNHVKYDVISRSKKSIENNSGKSNKSKRSWVQWHVKEELRQECLEINEYLEKIGIQNRVNMLQEDFENDMKNLVGKEVGNKFHYFIPEKIFIHDLIEEIPFANLTAEALKDAGAKVYWYGASSEFQSTIELQVSKLIGDFFVRQSVSIPGKINESINAFFDDFEKGVTQEQMRVQQNLNELLNLNENKDDKRKEIISDINKLNLEIEYFQKLFKEINCYGCD